MIVGVIFNRQFCLFMRTALLWMAAITALSSPVVCEDQGQRSWRWFIEEADRVSCQTTNGIDQLQRGQDSAIGLAHAALAAIFRNSSNIDSSAAGYAFNRLGDYYYRLAAFRSADSVWRNALLYNDRVTPASAAERDGSLFRLAILYRQNEGLLKASPVRARSLMFFSHVLEGSDTVSVRQLYAVGNLHGKLGIFDSIDVYNRRAVGAFERSPDADPYWYIYSLIMLGENVSKRMNSNIPNAVAQQDSAISFGERALRVAESRYGIEDTMTAWVCQRLGDYHERRGNYSVADSLWDRAWKINRSKLPPEHIESQGSIFRMAGVLASRGEYAEAEKLRLQAVTLREKTQGPRHPETAAMYMSLANLYREVGKYSQAAQACRHALVIRTEAILQIPSDLAGCYRFLGLLSCDQGNYAQAEEYLQKALRIRQESLGPNHGVTAGTYSDLAGLYLAWDRIEEAAEMSRQALTAEESFLGKEHPDIAGTLEQLAAVYIIQDRSADALALIKRALNITEKALGRDNVNYAQLLSERAAIYRMEHLYDEAERDYQRAVEVFERIPKGNEVALLASASGLARLEADRGKSSAAQGMFSLVDSIAAQNHTWMHPGLSAALEDYARFCLRTGNAAKALELSRRSYEIRIMNFSDGVSVLSERDALRYSRYLREARDLYVSSILATGVRADDLQKAIAAILSTKGEIADEMFRRNRRESDLTGGTDAALVDSLQFLRARLSHLYSQGAARYSQADYGSLISSTLAARNRVESELARLSNGQLGQSRPQSIEVGRVVSALPRGSTLVEYLQINQCVGAGTLGGPVYVAAVLTSGGSTSLKVLGSAKEIDAAVSRYREHLDRMAELQRLPSAEDVQDFRQIANNIYSRVIAPVKAFLPDSGIVIVSPDGALNTVSFPSLCDSQNRYLIESYRLHSVSAGRDVLRFEDHAYALQGLVALGDPDFDAAPADRSAIAVAEFADLGQETGPWSRGLRSVCLDPNEIHAGRLAGAKVEIEQVTRIWLEQTGLPARALVGAQASEEMLKTTASSAGVLHLATHGYYLSEKCRMRRLHGDSVGVDPSESNPLLLSGLLLAGANRLGKDTVDDRSGEDGVLTAEEVASLDLTKTRWVVLSACESGLGAIRNGEGVYGLQRAFQMAGARTVINSLWPVADWVTAQMMASLYEHMNEQLPDLMRGLALRQLADLRRRGQPDHPYLWAPFVAIGDWRSLLDTK
jgi:CHAT domain-containing protein/tetratricopeptide (TPR) repeat protein